MKINGLIQALVSATKGSRELDYAIAKEIGWRFHGEGAYKEWGLLWRDPITGEWEQPPWWTTSIDAAITLVPEEFVWQISTDFGPISWASLSNGDGVFWHHTRSESLSAPLALCIATLKARQIINENQENKLCRTHFTVNEA